MLAPVLLDLCKEHTQARSSETLPDLKTVPCLFDKEDEFRVITRGLNSEEIFSKFINTTHFVEAWMKRDISFNTEGVYNDIINQIRRVLVQSERRTNVPQNKFHHL